MHFIALFQSVIWPLKVGDNPTLIASLGISNESCPLQDLESGLGGHEQACTKEEEDNVAHGREDNACLEDLDGLLGGQPSRSHRGPAQRWRMMSRQVPRPTLRRVRRGRIEEVNHAEEEEIIMIFFQSSFKYLSLLQSVSTGAASFKPLSSNLSFTVSKTPSLSPPNTACASKFVQKSANYDCGDKNVKLYIKWCIIFGLDLCYTFSKHEMHSYCHKM